jgi:archaellum component FlaG (FlaF/FlaG flagellin family)
MTHTAIDDTAELRELNSRFIKNFILMDTVAHNEIIHQDFVCINGNGTISNRREYMEAWATAYSKTGYTTFSITDENIRIFTDMALVRSKTVYVKEVDGKQIAGNSVYTDTYIRENGRWWCVQAQITPVDR